MGGGSLGSAGYFASIGTAGANTTYTNYTGSASVDVTMPYIQLTYCQKTAGADLAEWIQSNQQIEKTNIVSVDPNNTEKVIASTTEYDSKVIGIITTVPGWLIGTESPDGVQMALAGRVPTKITLKNGEIKPGDPITTSTIPGAGMKATKAGPIVGKAMEAFNETSSTSDCQDPATGRTEKCGTILVFVNISWADPAANQTNASVADNNQLFYDQVTFDDDFTDGDLASINISDSPQENNPNTLERVTHVYKSTDSDKQSFVGVVSTKIGGNGDLLRRERINNQIISETRLINSGRIDAKISPTSKDINYGDPLTVSENEGMLKKASGPGMIIGWSLEKWNLSSGKQKIAVNISPTIYPEEDIFLTDTGQVNINYNIDESVLASLGYDGAKNEIEAASYSLNNSLQQPVTRLAQFAQISAAKITAGLITAKNIIADNIIAKNIFTKQIKSDVILTGDLTSTQATFDVATVSGTLTAQKISATEATFDVVYADRIISPEGNFSQVLTDKITSLRDEIRQIIAQRQAESTPSAIYTASSTWDTSEATLSAQTAQLSAGDLTLDGNLILGADLTLKGLASLNSVSVSSLLAVGQIALQDNILETTASTLFIQPSGAGTIPFLKIV